MLRNSGVIRSYIFACVFAGRMPGAVAHGTPGATLPCGTMLSVVSAEAEATGTAVASVTAAATMARRGSTWTLLLDRTAGDQRPAAGYTVLDALSTLAPTCVHWGPSAAVVGLLGVTANPAPRSASMPAPRRVVAEAVARAIARGHWPVP